MVSDITEEKVFALRMLGWRLRREGLDNHAIASRVDINANQVQSFLTGRGDVRAHGAHYPAMLPYLVDQYRQRGWAADRLLSQAYECLELDGESGADATSGETTPDLRRWISVSKEEYFAATKRLTGMWHLIRISSTKWSDANNPEFNISLLNIFPTAQIAGEDLPKFKHYIRGKHFARDDYHRIEGFVLVDSDRIYLVGKRLGTNSLQASLLSLPYRSSETDMHLEEIRGQANSFASSGHQVSAHYVAEYIPGTNELSGEAFEAKKIELRNQIGVFAQDAALERGLVADEGIFQMLLDWSKEPIFEEKN